MSRLGWAAYALGVALAVTAGLLAPQQPELFHGGAACNLAPCGTLEDPARWRATWWLFGAGATLVVVGLGLVLGRLPRGDWPRVAGWRWALGAGYGLVLWAVTAVAFFFAGLLFTAHLAAAVPLVAVPMVVVAVLLTLAAPVSRRSVLATCLLVAPAPVALSLWLLSG